MTMSGLPQQFTTEWVLEDKQFKSEMRSLAADMQSANQSMIKSITDVKSAWDLGVAAVRKFGAAVLDTASAGDKLGDLLGATTINVTAATRATSGLISQIDLLTASNRLSAVGVHLSTDQFAQFTHQVTAYAVATGKDATQALGEFTARLEGKARRAKDAESAVEAVTREMDRLAAATKGADIEIGGFSDALDQASVAWKDAQANAGVLLDSALTPLGKAWAGLAMLTRDATKAVEEYFSKSGSKLERLLSTVEGRGIVYDSRNYQRGYESEPQDVIAMMTPSPELQQLRLNRAAQAGEQRRTGKRKAGGEFTPGRGFGVEDAERAEQALYETDSRVLAAVEKEIDAQARRQAAYETASIGITAARKREQEQFDAITASMTESSAVYSKFNDDMRGLALGGIGAATSALYGFGEALIAGKESAGVAALGMLKAIGQQVMGTALAHALEMAGYAMERTAHATVPVAGLAWIPSATAAWASAAKWAAIAAVGGGVALGASAGQAALGGGGGSGGGGSRASQSGYRASSEGPRFGARKSADERPIVVQLYVDSSDPAAAILAARKLKAQIAKSN